MKKIYLQIGLILITFNNLYSQVDLKGKYDLSTGGMSIIFHPVDSDNNYGYAWYEAIYSNGYNFNAAYLLQNNILTLGNFNYGQDQAFKIVKNTGNKLVLETINIYPVQQFELLKSSTNNFIAGNNDTTAKILATKDGYNYTSLHFDKEMQFVEFVLGIKPTKHMIEQLRKDAINEFLKDPATDLQTIEQTHKSMQQLYNITDLVKIGLARNYFITSLLPALNNLDDNNTLKKLFFQYNTILAKDNINNMVLTRKDMDSYFDLMNFYAQLMGQNLTLDYKSRKQYESQIIQKFKQGDLNFNTNICIMNVLYQYTTAAYNQLTEDQKQQFTASLYTGYETTSQYQNYNQDPFQQGYNPVKDYTNPDNLWPPDVKTKAQKQAYLAKMRSKMSSNAACFDIMNNMMLNNHALGLNIANMSNDNYWMVTNRGY